MQISKCCKQPEFMPIMSTSICSQCMQQSEFKEKKEEIKKCNKK
jgi:hypothetical protein